MAKPAKEELDTKSKNSQAAESDKKSADSKPEEDKLDKAEVSPKPAEESQEVASDSPKDKPDLPVENKEAVAEKKTKEAVEKTEKVEDETISDPQDVPESTKFEMEVEELAKQLNRQFVLEEKYAFKLSIPKKIFLIVGIILIIGLIGFGIWFGLNS